MQREEIERLFDLRGRVAIVTGGSRGLGLEMATSFAAMGARVVVASRKAPACQEAARAIEQAGGEALAVPAHMGSLEDAERLVAAAVERFGAIDIVVNNAANALSQPLGEVTPDAWGKSHDVNLRGPLMLVQHALPELTKSAHASVINIVTSGVFTSGAGYAIYVSAKAGLMALTKAMAAEFVGRGIRVNAIAPGTFDTDMVRNNPPEVVAAMAGASPMGRIASPRELVGAALFLASDASSYVTGTTLVVDGGMTS